MGTIGFCRITLPIVLAASFHLFPTAPHAEVLAPEADSSVRGDLTVRRNDNYGCDPVLLVGGSRDGEAYGEPDAIRSFLRFDLSGITGQVSSATLELTVDGFRSDNPPQVFDLSVHRVLGSWNEETATSAARGPTPLAAPMSTLQKGSRGTAPTRTTRRNRASIPPPPPN